MQDFWRCYALGWWVARLQERLQIHWPFPLESVHCLDRFWLITFIPEFCCTQSCLRLGQILSLWVSLNCLIVVYKISYGLVDFFLRQQCRLLSQLGCSILLRLKLLNYRNPCQNWVKFGLNLLHTISKLIYRRELLSQASLSQIKALTHILRLNFQLVRRNLMLLCAILLLFHLHFPEVTQIDEVALQAQYLRAVAKHLWHRTLLGQR